jgi:hypothetical protein
LENGIESRKSPMNRWGKEGEVPVFSAYGMLVIIIPSCGSNTWML